MAIFKFLILPHGAFQRVLRWFNFLFLSYFCLFSSPVHHAVLDRTSWWGFWVGFWVIQGMAWKRWYDRAKPRAGIEDHFDKVSVVTNFILFLFGVVSIGFGGYWLRFAAWPLVLFFMLSNLIILFFHFRDHDPMYPNALSGDSRVF